TYTTPATTPTRRYSSTTTPYPFFFLITRHPQTSTLFPYTTLFRSIKKVNVVPMVEMMAKTAFQARNLATAAQYVDAMVADKDCRSEEHTSELQSLRHLVCRLLLEKKKQNTLQKITQ